MDEMRVVGRRYDTREPIAITIKNDGRISDIVIADRIADDRLPWIAPGK